MQHTLKYCLALCFLFICFSLKAATIRHNFNTKSGKGTLVYVDATHYSSTDDEITYTLSGASFYVVSSVVCLKLSSSGHYTTISPAFHNLHSVEINYIPNKDLNENLLVQISTNGSKWDTLSPATHEKGHLVANTPTDGDYYVKILRSGGSETISISQIIYTTTSGDCNCFPYTAE